MSDETNPFASPLAVSSDETGSSEPIEGGTRSLYKPTEGLGETLRTAFWLLIAESVLQIGTGVWYLTTLQGSWDQEGLSPAELAGLVVAMVLFVTYISTVVLFCKWKYRSYRNVQAFGATGLRFSPGWAVGHYFVPILNLFQPFRAMKDIFNGSRGDHVEEPTAVVSSWWAAFIVMGMCNRASNRAGIRAETLEQFQASGVVETIAAAVTVVASVLAMRVVRQVDERQKARAVTLGWESSDERSMFPGA